MTETQWLASDEPAPMLEFLRKKAGHRKSRLFAAACCRRIWPLLTDARSRNAVEVAEAFADGLCGKRKLASALNAADKVAEEICKTLLNNESPTRARGPDQAAAHAVNFAAIAASFTVVQQKWSAISPSEYAYSAAGKNAGNRSKRQNSYTNNKRQKLAEKAEKQQQTSLIRCVFGNPFRPVTFDRRWQTSTVIGLARSIYDERAFDRMPILADALMDAGCDIEDILNHCRQSSEHVRGCWVLDWLTEKK